MSVEADLVLDLAKSAIRTVDVDGILTGPGMRIVHEYAQAWVTRSERNIALEEAYPELRDLFYDIRADSDLARRHAS